MPDGLEAPGDLGWIALLIALIAIAWHAGTLKRPAARRALLAGAGVALLATPGMIAVTNTYSAPTALWVPLFYGPVVGAMVLVGFRDQVRSAVPR